MPTRLTALFQVTTDPTNRAVANQHTGGWSESFWTQLVGANRDAQFDAILQARQRLLPASASIIGTRRSEFTIQGNRLFPGPSSSAEVHYPGNTNNITDLPQVALQWKGQAATGPNRNSWFIRCVPDAFMEGGEFNPGRAYLVAMESYRGRIANGSWGFVGRDLQQPRVRLITVVGGIVQTEAPVPGLAVGGFMRFSRVYDTTGRPVSGSFAVTLAAGNLYTVVGLTGISVLVPSGTVRNDLIAYTAYASVNYTRARVKKIGRPSEGYRGRRS